MIIACPECSTKFAIDPERIAGSGAKMRCARCKYVFVVEKPQPEPVSPPAPPDEPAPLSTQNDNLVSPLPFESLSLPDDPPVSEIDDVDFDYDQFQELDADKNLRDEPDEEPTHGQKPNDSENSESAPAAVTADKFSDSFPAKPGAKEPATAPERSPNSSPLATLIKILLVLFLAILMIGAVLVYLNGPEHLNQMIRQHLGQQTYDRSQGGEITLGQVNGRFLTNERAGELFLIRGEVINNFSQPRSAIQVKGILYDQHGKPLMQKTVFCGNPISDEDLRTLTFNELEQKMGNQFGKDLSNMQIAPGRSIPFDIVFKELPPNISEFSVTVTASNPTTP